VRGATKVTAAASRMGPAAHVSAAAPMTATAAMLRHRRRRNAQHGADHSRQENVPTLDAHDFNSP
jgi:hypothetical protein